MKYKLPQLPLERWEPTKKTLHLYAQIIGKVRMTLMPKQNHWWHVPLYVHTRGLTTGSIPVNGQRLEIRFDFIDHKLNFQTSNGQTNNFELQDGLTVASFYRKVFSVLDDWDIDVDILAKPFDHESTTHFADDESHHHYDKEYVQRFWNILLFADHTFKVFSGGFNGKTCPVQLYWHSFDLAVTRFSGKKVPDRPEAGQVENEAYSHEVISFGFWPGDENVREPAFYSYTYPAPEGLDRQPLKPEKAHWVEQNGSPMALLMYKNIRNADDPAKTLLAFLESAYRAGAQKAGWNMEQFELKT